MRQKIFFLGSFLFFLVFFSSVVSSVPFEIYVEVVNVTGGLNRPVAGASVSISAVINGNSFSWNGLTGQNGLTPDIAVDVPSGVLQSFDVIVNKEGFRNWNRTVSIAVGPILNLQRIKLVTANLTEIGVCNENSVCESSRGENTQNCPIDCPPPVPSEGLLQDLVFITSTQSNPMSCPTGYVERGSFNTLFSQSQQRKICAKFVESFVPGTYVKKAYVRQLISEQDCETGDVSIGQFISGSSYAVCVGKGNVNSLVDTFVSNVAVSSSCTSSDSRSPDGGFRDYSNNILYMCTRVQNPARNDSNCTLSNPVWTQVQNPSNQLGNVVGWVGVGVTGCINLNYGNYDYQNGIRDLMLYVGAEGCRNRNVVFEIYEHDNPSGQGDKTLKYTLSSTWSAGSMYAGWCPEWASGGPGNQNSDKYYSYKAIVQGAVPEKSVVSSILTVKKPSDAECKYDDTGSEEDDAACRRKYGEGFVCELGNKCVNFRCSASAPCSEDKICCPSGVSCQEGTCVECYNDVHCTGSAKFGKGYFCNMSSFRCFYNESCIIEKPEWVDIYKDPEELLDLSRKYPGTISGNKDYQEGVDVGLRTTTKGCEEVSNLVFVVVEDNGLLKSVDSSVPGVKLVPISSGANSFLSFRGFKPFWFIDTQMFLSQNIGFRYRAYVASESNLEKRLSPLSDPLEITKPPRSECKYGEEGADQVCVRKKGAGRICGEKNVCVNECSQDSDCEDGKICAVEENGKIGAFIKVNEEDPYLFMEFAEARKGRCYECFNDDFCSLREDDKKKCALSGEKKFSCVQCDVSADCSEDSGGNPGICLKNECTQMCNPSRVKGNPNIDCSSLAVVFSQEEINSKTNEERAEMKAKDICEPGNQVCVQCTQDLHCYSGTYCFNKAANDHYNQILNEKNNQQSQQSGGGFPNFQNLLFPGGGNIFGGLFGGLGNQGSNQGSQNNNQNQQQVTSPNMNKCVVCWNDGHCGTFQKCNENNVCEFKVQKDFSIGEQIALTLLAPIIVVISVIGQLFGGFGAIILAFWY